MKKIVSILFMLALSFSLLAQKSAVTSAWSYLKDGFLDDAKKSIDKAAENPKTQAWYKTHYFKGLIYQALGDSQEASYKKLCGDDCFDIAYNSYLQALKLNFVKDEYKDLNIESAEGFFKFVRIIAEKNERNYESTETIYDIIDVRFPRLTDAFFNIGLENYNKNNFEKAYNNFEKSLKIAQLSLREDHQLAFITSLVALKTERFDETITLSDVLIKADYGENDEDKVGPYLNKAVAYKLKGDTVKMLETIETGIAKFPKENKSLVIEAFNIYVSTGNDDKAYEYISLVIEKDPTNPEFYVTRGTLSETLKRLDIAESDYLKAYKLDNTGFEVNYALGAFYYNKAVDAIAWAEQNIPMTDVEANKKHSEETKETFTKAIPYLEKAREIQPKNSDVLNTLKIIYYRVGETDKYNKVNKELKEMTEEKK